MHRSHPRAPRLALLLALAVVGLGALGALVWRASAVGSAGGVTSAAADPDDDSAPTLPGVAVVELFTSQGCSSCPPADRLLSEIAADPELGGRVLPLAFHVDYWNRLGWRDPFSSRRWSERQGRYSERLDSGVYTPQVVVNGRSECVGSRRGQVIARIREALEAAPAAEVGLSLAADPALPGRLVATVTARWSEAEASRGRIPERAEIWAALWQDGRRTEVTRGENADRRLANDRVVRRLEKVGTLAAGLDGAGGRVTLELEEAWGESGLGVVAFVQDPRTLEIFGAAAARPPRS